jgi:sugar phosphate isomerase/epimerase
MRLGICHQVTLPGSWEEAIASAGALGVDGIELFVREGDVPAFLEDPAVARDVRARADQAGVEICSLVLVYLMRGAISLSDASGATRGQAVQSAGQAIRRCAEVGGKVVLVGAFGVEAPADVEAYVASLRELAPVARGAGVRIGIESNLAGAEVLALLERIGSPDVVGDYYDMGNAAGKEMDPAEEVRRRKGHLVQVHAKGVRGAGFDAGTLDLGAVRDALREAEYDGWLLLETSAGDDAMGNARRNLAVLRQAFAL